MKKVTKKELVEKANEHELRLFQIEKALEQHGINWFVEEPKLKQLDQSVFDHKYVTNHFYYVAINANGQSIFFSDKPKCNLELGIWYSTAGSTMPMLKGYDASNWENSLIERKELTGSDLCRAMLERGDNYIMCRVGLIKEVVIINKFEDGWFYSQGIRRADPIPINNQGEPLTQSDVGL